MPKCILALLLGSPIDLPNNLFSNLGEIDRSGSAFALGVLQILGDVNLGSKQSGLDQEVSLESGMHDSHGGGVARQPDETKSRINGSIREVDVKRGVPGERVDGEFPTRKVFGGSEEGDVTMDGAVRGLDEELGETSQLILVVTGRFLFGIIRKGDVDGDGRVPGLEDQELGSGEVSNDDIVLGPNVTAINAQSLWTLTVSQLCRKTIWGNFRTSALIGKNRVAASKSLILRSASAKR